MFNKVMRSRVSVEVDQHLAVCAGKGEGRSLLILYYSKI